MTFGCHKFAPNNTLFSLKSPLACNLDPLQNINRDKHLRVTNWQFSFIIRNETLLYCLSWCTLYSGLKRLGMPKL